MPRATADLAGPGFAALLELLGTGKTWVKLSAPYYGGADPPGYLLATEFARRLYAARPDRMLFGTNWPHPQADPVPDEGDLVDWIAAITAGEVGLRQVLVDNPARTLWLPRRLTAGAVAEPLSAAGAGVAVDPVDRGRQ